MTKTLTIRWLHIVAALYNLAFIYSPLHDWEHGFAIVQWVSTPALIVTGLLLVRSRKKAHAHQRIPHTARA